MSPGFVHTSSIVSGATTSPKRGSCGEVGIGVDQAVDADRIAPTSQDRQAHGVAREMEGHRLADVELELTHGGAHEAARRVRYAHR